MKRLILAVICVVMVAVFSVGCSAGEIAALQSQVEGLSQQLSKLEVPNPSAEASPTAEPQAAVAQAAGMEETVSKASETQNEEAIALSVNNASAEEIYAQLAEIDRLENELDLEDDALKLKYRNGEITREDYIAAKTDIELREDELDLQQDELELQLDALRLNQAPKNTSAASNAPQAKPQSTPAATQKKVKPIQTQSNNSEAAARLAEINRQEDALDREEDALEHQYKSGQIDYQTYKAREAEIDRQEDALDIEEDALEHQYGYDD